MRKKKQLNPHDLTNVALSVFKDAALMLDEAAVLHTQRSVEAEDTANELEEQARVIREESYAEEDKAYEAAERAVSIRSLLTL